MERRLLPWLLLVLLFLAPAIFAETVLEKADQLYDQDLNREGYALLKGALETTSGASERAELYWRLARATLEVGNTEETEGASEAKLLARFQEGEGYADEAISLAPGNFEAYYWKSANIGRWGEVKGILNSLFKAKPMRELLHTTLDFNPNHAASFYVLGILYERVPGPPISFGNNSYAVSLARKSVDANRAEIEAGIEDEVKLTHFMELARHLKARNWSQTKRRREHPKEAARYAKESDILKKNFYYEGVVDIPDMSDKDEALQLIRWVVSSYQKKPTLSKSEQGDFEDAQADLESWTK